MSRDERILQRKLSCQIRRIDGFIETVDSIIEAGETVRLEIMGEELKEIKEKIEKLYDELFSLDEVDIDKESEAYDSSMNKIGSLRPRTTRNSWNQDKKWTRKVMHLQSPTGQRFPSHHDNKRMLRKIGTCPKEIRSDDYRGWKHTSAAFFIDKLEFVMKGFWETESVPSPDLCTQDEDCESLFSNNHGRDSHGRFRTYPVAITADIEKMYRQIRIHPEDADYQRILWRPSPEESVVDYRLLTVTYGTTSAPFLAMRTLQQLAEDEGQNYPEASRVTLNDFYVDDLLTGAQTIAETKELIDQLKDLMKKGGFHLRKWNSNCHEIVSHVEEMNEEKKINLEKGAISKILGIVWDHVQDTFRVNITLPEEVVTKRDLLSNIARIFDPIGFLSPTTVALKIIMQELWRDPNRWKTFIHNRVVKIQQLSDRNSWRHVSGKDNPADCASRGIMPAALSGHTLWWQGPTWLKDNNFVQNQDNCYGRECHEEEKVALACQSRVSVCPEIVTKYSTFIKTRRIIAWCLRFITNCRVSLKKREIGTLSKKELENAVIRIIGWIQEDEFGEERQDLRNTGHASRKSRILQLNPFIDASGMLRVGGRIKFANVECTNYPIVQIGFQLVPHPPYSKDLAPCDSFLNLRKWLRGRKCSSHEEVIENLIGYFEFNWNIGESEIRELLQQWREDNVRKPEDVIQFWDQSLSHNIHKLGDEKWVVYEQVCMAALDVARLDIIQECIHELDHQFPSSLRVRKLKAMHYEVLERVNLFEDACYTESGGVTVHLAWQAFFVKV
ncbi:hypothetical protein LAZ67_16002290 [Cordylochernes scorpioides]|uniref:Reverse transcriptase domain-containing protein n=1 Tax=Cordylochernes scorpioides TaxID=51811 RepID=A0ABY6LCT2_9ARAC|nr:hypothetical protein LAZ67_16002290 [Cordylochernes scorpioides]